MRARTEDLLTIRDGEPIDAALRERVAADPENALEIERLTRAMEDLRRLPHLEPPPGMWERIAAEAAPRRPRGLRRAAYWAAAAAALAVAAVLLGDAWRTVDRVETADTRNDEPRSRAPLELDSTAEPALDVDYARLVAESVRLELLLAEIAPSPQLMNAGTARTIADLEDRIVLVDEQLTYAEARDVDPRYRQALWRERVDVMNALLHVRYAQVQVPNY